jgi:hypothetical protein
MSNTEPIFEYDANGNLIYYKNRDGFEFWYDSDGKPIDNPSKEG